MAFSLSLWFGKATVLANGGERGRSWRGARGGLGDWIGQAGLGVSGMGGGGSDGGGRGCNDVGKDGQGLSGCQQCVGGGGGGGRMVVGRGGGPDGRLRVVSSSGGGQEGRWLLEEEAIS
ncbi:hypothetical protein Acr_23g0006860 [Actinidia rufa]|uniref:Uncharacterized protein n=1 Tax=Actinidia rufa TaxID=165716 RepID=A0A7J0GNG3_9ERIC|nr:hypothetical protein Acr_23g0006860 [Actinidia rufa]